MAQIRSKQIKDFLSTVNWATVAQNEIANASDVKAYVDTEVSALGLDANASIDSLEVALSAEIVATNEDVTALIAADSTEKARAEAAELSLETAISVEEDRIDAILDAVNANPDSFADVVSIINAVDLENDDALAAVIVSLNNEIAATNSDVTRLDGADSTEKLRAMTAEGVLSTDLAAELVARANGDTANATAISNEETRAIAAEGSLETKFDGEVSRLDGELSAEISATNSEVVRLDGLHSTLSTEVVDEVASIDARLGAVSGDLVDSVDSLEVALSAEISATNADVVSIDAAYIAADSLEVIARDAAILVEKNRAMAAEGVLSTDLAAELSRATAAELSLTTRVSQEESTRLANDNTLQANIDAENARIDAILDAVDANPDSFADVVAIINAVDLENDNALAAVIVSLNNEIASTNEDVSGINASIDSLENLTGASFTSLETRLSVEEAALVAEIADTNADVTRLEGELSTEISAEVVARDAAILVEKLRAEAAELLNATNLSDYETSNDAALAQEILDRDAAILVEKLRAEGVEAGLQSALTAEIAATDAEQIAQNNRLDVLEATIIEDNEMAVESFVGAGFVYTVANPVQDDNKFLVSAYVNGHKVEVSVVAGTQVTLANPNYVIDPQDSVVITYQF